MEKDQKKALVRIIIALILGVAAYFIPVQGIWKALIFAVPYLIAGYDVYLDFFRGIRSSDSADGEFFMWFGGHNLKVEVNDERELKGALHSRIFDEKFLMIIATLGAFAAGEYPEAAAVMIFYQVGELFQDIAVGKSRRSIAELMDIRPERAVVLRGGEEIEIAPEDAALGETMIVRPGEKIALDGEIIEGSTSVNTSALTGESLPADKGVGDSVISGCVNLSGVIKVKITSLYNDSTVAKILELVENSYERKAKTENFISRFAEWYTPCVVIGAVLLALVPPLYFGQAWSVWFKRALIFLVVSCPCALVVSVPLSFFGGIGAASKGGVLIKGANYLEALANADTVVFDKTGTLTKGTFTVNAIHSEKMSEAKLLDIAAAAESYSNHPVALSIVKAHSGHISKRQVSSVKELPGLGLEAVIDEGTYYLGSGALMDKCGAAWHECSLGGTVIHIANESEYLGHIVISDELKEDSASAIKELKKLGISKTVMLTGDNEQTAGAFASQAGVDEYRSSLLPADKVKVLESIISERRHPVFVGDGINDAPVLTRADVGVAMGAMGSDAAIESADIVIMDDKPEKLPFAIRLSRKTMRIAKENIWFALGVKIIILLLSALGITGMWTAVFGDVGVMVIAILNALRCLKGVKK